MKVGLNSTYTEKELLLLISAGDTRAFRHLYDNYHNKIFSISFKFTGEKQASEDAVQDIFIKLWTNKEKLPEIKNFNAYLNKVIRNHVFNYLRKIAYQEELIKKMQVVQTEENENDLIDTIYCNELSNIINRAIEQLPAQQKKAYNYSRVEGLKHKEIADTMGISRSTVKGHIVEALKHIKSTINANAEIDVIIMCLLPFVLYLTSL